MYFKDKTIKNKKYRYVLKSIRLPNGKIKTLEKLYKNETKEKLNKFFEEKEEKEHIKYSLNKFGTDHIFTEQEIAKIEKIKLDYKKIIKNLPRENIKDLLDRFTANFTYESNALEGNSLTLKDVSIVMFEDISVEGKDLREIYETRNSRKVVEFIMKNRFNISHDSIMKMHKLLVKDIDIRTGYKKRPNFILGKKVKTSPPEKVYNDMTNLINWYNENKDKIHPLRLVATFHGKFEQIHPFEDGNGRVGRFLINLILTKNKYPPLIIRKFQRSSYLKSLENFDGGYYYTLERLMLERFKETYRKFFEIYIKYI